MDIPHAAGVTSSGDRANFSENVTVGNVQGDLVLNVTRFTDAVSSPYNTANEHFQRASREANSIRALLKDFRKSVDEAESRGLRGQSERFKPAITSCEDTLLWFETLKRQFDALENPKDRSKSEELKFVESRFGRDVSVLTASLHLLSQTTVESRTLPPLPRDPLPLPNEIERSLVLPSQSSPIPALHLIGREENPQPKLSTLGGDPSQSSVETTSEKPDQTNAVDSNTSTELEMKMLQPELSTLGGDPSQSSVETTSEKPDQTNTVDSNTSTELEMKMLQPELSTLGGNLSQGSVETTSEKPDQTNAVDSNPAIEPEMKGLEPKTSMIVESYHPFDTMSQTIVDAHDAQGLGQTPISKTAKAPSASMEMLLTLAAVSLPVSEVVLFPILYSMAPTTASVVEYYGILWAPPGNLRFKNFTLILIFVLVIPLLVVPGNESVVPGPSASVPEKEIPTIESLNDPGATQSLYAPTSWFRSEYTPSATAIDASSTKIPEHLVYAVTTQPISPFSDPIPASPTDLVTPSPRPTPFETSNASYNFRVQIFNTRWIQIQFLDLRNRLQMEDIHITLMRDNMIINPEIVENTDMSILLLLPEAEAHGFFDTAVTAVTDPGLSVALLLDFDNQNGADDSSVAHNPDSTSTLTITEQSNQKTGFAHRLLSGVLLARQYLAIYLLGFMSLSRVFKLWDRTSYESRDLLFMSTISPWLLASVFASRAIPNSVLGYAINALLLIVELLGFLFEYLLLAGVYYREGFRKTNITNTMITVLYWLICVTDPSLTSWFAWQIVQYAFFTAQLIYFMGIIAGLGHRKGIAFGFCCVAGSIFLGMVLAFCFGGLAAVASRFKNTPWYGLPAAQIISVVWVSVFFAVYKKEYPIPFPDGYVARDAIGVYVLLTLAFEAVMYLGVGKSIY